MKLRETIDKFYKNIDNKNYPTSLQKIDEFIKNFPIKFKDDEGVLTFLKEKINKETLSKMAKIYIHYSHSIYCNEQENYKQKKLSDIELYRMEELTNSLKYMRHSINYLALYSRFLQHSNLLPEKEMHYEIEKARADFDTYNRFKETIKTQISKIRHENDQWSELHANLLGKKEKRNLNEEAFLQKYYNEHPEEPLFPITEEENNQPWSERTKNNNDQNIIR